MNRILIIADDFTGAAEIGGIATEFGLPAQIAFGHFPAASADVLVIDTNSRHLSQGEAAAQLRGVLVGAERGHFDLVFKKTDSVLRGSVVAELETIRETLGFARCLLIPQNPSRGRTIEKGEYLIDGTPLHRTAFANDPDFPAKSADVQQILGGDVRSRAVDESPDENGITIGDGKNADDLDRWAAELNDKKMAAGGADFFTAILRRHGLVRADRPGPVIDLNRSLFICGSAAGQRSVGGFSRHCTMPKILFDAPVADEGALEQWREDICNELQVSGRAMVSVGHDVVPGRAGHVRRMLGEVAKRVFHSCAPGALFVEGGATAASVIQRLGWMDLQIEGELSGGVVVLRPLEKPGQVLVVKPGSYHWPASLLH